MTSSHPGWPGVLTALMYALCYSTLAIFIKLAFSYHLTVTTIVVMRMVLASVLLWLTLLLDKTSRRNWVIAPQDWPFFLGGVVLTFAANVRRRPHFRRIADIGMAVKADAAQPSQPEKPREPRCLVLKLITQ